MSEQHGNPVYYNINFFHGDGGFLSSSADNPIGSNDTCIDFVNYVVNEPKLVDKRNYVLMNLNYLDFLYLSPTSIVNNANQCINPEYDVNKGQDSSKAIHWLDKPTISSLVLQAYAPNLLYALNNKHKCVIAFSMRRAENYFNDSDSYDCWVLNTRIDINDNKGLFWNYLLCKCLDHYLYKLFHLSMKCSEITNPIDAGYWYEDYEINDDISLKFYIDTQFKDCHDIFEIRLNIINDYYKFDDKMSDLMFELYDEGGIPCDILHPYRICQAKYFEKYRNKEMSMDEAVSNCISKVKEMIADGEINENDFM